MTDTLAMYRPLPHVSLQTGHRSDISSANRAAGISPAVEQMTGKKLRSLNTGRATLDGSHPQFVRCVCVTLAAATVDVPHGHQ